MSLKKAQAIVNKLDEELNLDLTIYQNSELELIKTQIERFLDMNVETEDLISPGDITLGDDEIEETDEDHLFEEEEEDGN